MMVYIVETICFQLLFLMLYLALLRRETFFRHNRLYLLATFTMAFILPMVKFPFLQLTNTPLSLNFEGAMHLMGANANATVLVPEANSIFPWYVYLWFLGMVVATVRFLGTLRDLRRLKASGKTTVEKDHILVVLPSSRMAFSFFDIIYIGEDLSALERKEILRHEMVHLRQRHSMDILFFEGMRIVFWFNPLVYAYQIHLKQVHEYLADAAIPQAARHWYMQLLLAHVFQITDTAPVNHFYHKSFLKTVLSC